MSDELLLKINEVRGMVSLAKNNIHHAEELLYEIAREINKIDTNDMDELKKEHRKLLDETDFGAEDIYHSLYHEMKVLQ